MFNVKLNPLCIENLLATFLILLAGFTHFMGDYHLLVRTRVFWSAYASSCHAHVSRWSAHVSSWHAQASHWSAYASSCRAHVPRWSAQASHWCAYASSCRAHVSRWSAHASFGAHRHLIGAHTYLHGTHTHLDGAHTHLGGTKRIRVLWIGVFQLFLRISDL